MFKYLGYSSHEMIMYIAKFSYSMNLNKCGECWELEVVDLDGTDNTYASSSMVEVLISAFKPHLESANIEREEIRAMLYGGDGLRAEKIFLKRLAAAKIKKVEG